MKVKYKIWQCHNAGECGEKEDDKRHFTAFVPRIQFVRIIRFLLTFPPEVNKSRGAVTEAKPGLITNKLPIKAIHTQLAANGCIFSFRSRNENKMAKNRDSLFKIDASAGIR